MKMRFLMALALALVLLSAGCGRRQAALSPTPPPPPPTAKAVLPGPTTPPKVPDTATPQPTAAPISPVQTPPVSPLSTPAPISPLATPSGAGQATPRAAARSNAATPLAGEAAQASLAARTFVADQNNWRLSEVQVKQIEPVMWSDSCLGINQPGMMCAQVITPGYRIILSTPKGDIEVHTDRSGRAVRVATM
jgi:hypothetical protein